MDDPLAHPVSELLDVLADRRRSPGAGSLAAIATCAAAAIATRAARYSGTAWAGAEGAAAQGEALRRRTAPLAARGADVFGKALDALDEPREPDPDRRNWQLGRALRDSADVPLQIAEAAADVAALAAEIAERGNPELRPDVAAAAVLAEAGARMSAHLVAVNLGAGPGDERIERAEALVVFATEHARKALAER